MLENNENIPLDEMMRNLKKGATRKRAEAKESGERVVRADGSEAIKVKSKKRRTVQPKEEAVKKKTKRKVIFIAVAIGCILLSIITFSILLGYFNGSRFKSKVSETITNVSGAKVELGKLDVSAASASLSTVDLDWSNVGTLIKDLSLKGVNADYSLLAFFGQGGSSSSVAVAEGVLNLEMVSENPQLATKPERPVDLKFGLYQCSSMTINFGEDSLWSFKDGAVSYRVDDENLDQLSIDAGLFNIPSFGEFKVNNGLLGFNKDKAQVYLGMESQDHGGVINIDGTSGYTAGSLVDMQTELLNYSLKDWIDPRARRFFSGEISLGKGTLKMKLGDVESVDTTTKLAMSVIKLNDFEFIKTLSLMLNDDFYANPLFKNQSSMTMTRSKDKTLFTDIAFKQDGKMQIKGDLIIDELNNFRGDLKVGLSVEVLSTRHGKEIGEVFVDSDGEYVWAKVELGGTVSHPNDDLDVQFKEMNIKSGVQVPHFELKFEESSR